MGHAVALSSGTAALHLALLLVGVGPGDEVLVPSFTFVATATAVTYLGATPVFVDCSPTNWTIDPDLVAEELADRARQRAAARRPWSPSTSTARRADYDALAPLCEQYGIPLVEDAAEALGASYRGRPAGSFGRAGVFSFNGNKIITTSGGGMLVSDSAELAARARHLATQARDPFPHYEHSDARLQLPAEQPAGRPGPGPAPRPRPPHRTAAGPSTQRYRAALGGLPGIELHAHRPLRRAQLLADLHHGRPRASSAPTASRSGWPSRRGHRVPADLEAPPPPTGVRGSADRRGRGLRLHLRAAVCACPPARRLSPADQDRVVETIESCGADRPDVGR